MGDTFVGFTAEKSWLSKLIRWVTSSTVSHCFIKFTDAGKEWALSDDWRGPEIILWSDYQKQATVVELIPAKVDLLPALKLEIYKDDVLSQGYGYGDLCGMLWVYLGRKFGKSWSNPLNTRASICSEITARIIKEAGWSGSEKLDPSATSPADLLTFCKK